jgi:ferrous iron transport protein A
VNLCDVACGGSVRILSLDAAGLERRRLTELGVRRGAVVHVIRQAPLNGPIALRVGGGLLALRPENAKHVLVEPTP